MSKENLITIDLSLLDFSLFNFLDVDLAKVDLTNTDFSKADPHLICLMIFFPFLSQKIEREKEGFYLENGYYNYSWIDSETKNKHSCNFNFVGSILVRPQEKKESSEKLKDGYRIEVPGTAREGGNFSVIYLVKKTVRLKSDFTLDVEKPYSTSSKKRIIKKQKGTDTIPHKNDQWKVKLNGEYIYKDKVLRELFEKESSILKKYPKLSAKTLIESKRPDGEYFVFQIMKQAPGQNLYDLLEPENYEDKQPDFQTRLSLFLALVQEVKDMHDKHKIIHCDLKPENICVDSDSDSSHFNITLIDFGGSRSIGDQDTKDLACQGTDPYFAPEQDSYGAEDITVKVDVHALGQMIKKDFFTTDPQEELYSKDFDDEKVPFIEYNEELSECEKKQNKALQNLAKEMTCVEPEDRLNLDQVMQRLQSIQQALVAKEENQVEPSVIALEIDAEAKKMDCFPDSSSVDSGLELSQQSATSGSDLSDLYNVEDLDVISSVNLLQLDLTASVISNFFRHLYEKIAENENKAFYCPPAYYIYSGTDEEGKSCTYKLHLSNSIIVRRQEQKESQKPKDGYRIEVLGAAEDKDGAFSLFSPVLNTIRLNSNFILDKNKPFSNKKRIVKLQQLSKANSDDKSGIDAIKKKEVVLVAEVEKENRLLKTYAKLGAKTLVECEYGSNNGQRVYQIMKEAPGERLDSFLNLDLKKERLPDFQTRLKIFLALAREVQALNIDKEIVHCDLKPANIFVKYSEDEDSSATEITLIDFGAGVSTQDQELDLIQTISPFYYAPEQKVMSYSPQADIYALGQMIKKDFFPTDTKSIGGQGRLKELPEDQQAMHFVYKKRVEEEKLSSSEQKQKAALQDLARRMTYFDPVARLDMAQVIEKLNIIQNDNSLATENEAEVENRSLQSEGSSFEETGSCESDSDDSGIDFANRSSTSSENSFALSNSDEGLAEDAALDSSESSTAHSAVLASADPSSLQEEANQVLSENADLFATENEEVEDQTISQQSDEASSEETASYKNDSGDSAVDLANRSPTSSEHSSDMSSLDENLAEYTDLDKAVSRTNDSTVLTSASPSLSPEETAMKWTKQAMLLARLEKKMNKNLGFAPMQDDLAKLVAKIKEHRYFKEKLKEEETLNQPAKEDFFLTANLAKALFALLQQVPDSHQEVDKFDLNLRQAVIDYIAQTYTLDNIKKEDRAVSQRRAEDIGRLLTQLHGTQGERPKTELELEVKVKDWAKKVTNSMGFFGQSALRSGVLAAMDVASNTAPVKPPSVFNCFRAFIR